MKNEKKHFNVRVIVEEVTDSHEEDSRGSRVPNSQKTSTITLVEVKTQAPSLASAVRKVKAALDVEVAETEINMPSRGSLDNVQVRAEPDTVLRPRPARDIPQA